MLFHVAQVLLAVAGLADDQAAILSWSAIGCHKGERGAVVMSRSAKICNDGGAESHGGDRVPKVIWKINKMKAKE